MIEMPKPRIRCSQLPQLLECGASRILMPLVKPRDGTEGYEGVETHWRVASRAVHELGATPPPGGLPPANVPAGFKLPKNSEWLVGYFFNVLKHGADACYSILVENELAYEFDRFILTGHPDVIALDAEATFADIYDWKCGRQPVAPAPQNSQGLGYLALTRRAWPTLRSARFTIAQPHNRPEEGHERVTAVEVEGAQLDRCVAYLEEQVDAQLDRWREINSGMKQCQWCPVGIQCPAIRALIEFMKMTLTPEMLARITREPDDALLGDIIIAARSVSKAVDEANELLHARIDANQGVVAGDGTTITRKTQGGNYEITDPAAMFGALSELLPPASLATVLNYPVGRIKDALAETMDIPKGGKGAITAETVFAAKFGPFVKQGTKRLLVFN